MPSKPRKKDLPSLSIPPPHPIGSSSPLPPPRSNGSSSPLGPPHSNGSSSPLPPPRPNGSSSPLPPPRLKNTSSPPLPPSRQSNTPSPPEQRYSPPPPPVPKRIPGQSDRRIQGITRYNSVSDTSNKVHHRIKPYKTTEIRNPESDTGSSSDHSSGDMFVRHSLSFDEKDLINPVSAETILKTTPTKPNKPLPPVKPRSTNNESSAQKSKLTSSRSPSPQTIGRKLPPNDVRPSYTSTTRQNPTPTEIKTRPPAILPKPKPSKPTPPSKVDLNQSCSSPLTLPSKNDFSTSSEHDFNSSGGRYPSHKTSKRPPLPLPKPKV